MQIQLVSVILVFTILLTTLILYGRCKKRRVDNYIKNNSDKQSQFLQTLEDMADILDANNISFFLFTGTALGCHREGRFIEHDPDIDLGMEEDAFGRLENLTSDITEGDGRKFRLEAFYPKEGGEKKEICFMHLVTGVKIDIIKLTKSSSGYIHYTYTGPCEERPNKRCEYINKFEIEWKDFMGRRYMVPSIDFLESHYGSSWKSPQVYSYIESIKDGHIRSLI